MGLQIIRADSVAALRVQKGRAELQAENEQLKEKVFTLDIEKAGTAAATTESAGLMSAEDKIKLDGIAVNANKYTHPNSHAASMITQDAAHRFATDTEKNAWNGKQDKSSSVSVTIPTTGWGSDSTAVYSRYYDIAVSGVTANDRADIMVAPSGAGTAVACGLCPVSETLSGKIRLRAVTLPTANILIEYWIEQGKE